MLILDTVYVASDISGLWLLTTPLSFTRSGTFGNTLLKGTVHPKMKMVSLITHPHVVPIRNLQDIRSSSEHKCKYNFLYFESSQTLHRQQGSVHDQGPET